MRKGFIYGMFGCFGVGAAIVLVIIVVASFGSAGRTTTGPGTSVTATSNASPVTPKQWVVVAHFTIRGQRNTEPFTVGPRWRFSWQTCGRDPDLTPYYAEGPDAGYNIGSAGGSPEGTENLYNKPGRYYLSVLVFDNPCVITVEDFR